MPAESHTLHLTLHREFFAQIVAGTKRTEFRDRTKYWKTRLEGRRYDRIQFRNGYARHAPVMVVEFRGLRIEGTARSGRYAIRLGKLLSIRRWKP